MSCLLKENFKCAITLWLQCAHNEKKMCNSQYIYLAPGGDFCLQKELKTITIDHQHQFEELLQILKLLPAGNIADPKEGLQVEWFYNSFHMEDCKEYVKSGRNLANETVELAAEYFSAIYDTQAIHGDLDHKHNALIHVLEQHHVHCKLHKCSSNLPIIATS